MTTVPRLAYIYSLIFLYAMWIFPAYAAVPIQRISLADALFVGQTTTVPPSPVPLHSIIDFENNYGKLPPEGLGTLYELWIAAASFFEQGGENLYIAPLTGDSGPERYRQALNGFNATSYIGLIAAPGYSRLSNTERYVVAATLINAAEISGYGFAILEHEKTSTVDELLTERTRYSTPHAALYTPWAELYDSQNSSTASIPPSGAMAGVIAKSEIDNGVDAAPAGILLNGLSGLNTYYTDEEVNLLAANNLNPLRFFTPADYKVWGARTMSDNADTRYVSVQRYGSQLELSIRLGTAWVIAEANSEPFWTTLETQIQTFLHEEWLRGALVGVAPEEAYYAKCDLTTMSAEDIAAGRTICTWGVSLTRPAEFSVFTLTHERNLAPADTESPAGYTLRTTETTTGSLNETALELQIDKAEIGSRYKYYIGSTGGPEVLYSEGEVTAGSFSTTEGRIASLSSGDIHVYLSLTDSAGNLGPWVSPTRENNFNWLMFLPTITKQKKK